VDIYEAIGLLPQVAALEQDWLATRGIHTRYAVGAMTALARQGKYEEALAVVDSLPRHVAEAPEVMAATAEALVGLGNYEEAWQTMAGTPGRMQPSASLQMARLYEADGRYQEALWEYGRALAGEKETEEAATAIRRLCTKGHVGLPAALQVLSWAYRDSPRPGAICRIAASLAAALSDAEPLHWLATPPPPD